MHTSNILIQNAQRADGRGEDDTLLSNDMLRTSEEVHEKNEATRFKSISPLLAHDDIGNCDGGNSFPPRHPKSSAENTGLNFTTESRMAQKRPETPEDLEIQRRFHELCYSVKSKLMEEDEYNTTFNMSIQELYDISRFLNVPESEWQNFIPMQLSQGSPAAMSWIIKLVKSLKEKDSQIYQLKEHMMHIVDTVTVLHSRVLALEAQNKSKNTVNVAPTESQNQRSNHKTAKQSTKLEWKHSRSVTKSRVEKDNVKNNTVNTKQSKRTQEQSKLQSKQAQNAPKSFRSAKDFIKAYDSDTPGPSFDKSSKTNDKRIYNRSKWLQEQLLRNDKSVDAEQNFDNHVPFVANWNVDYSKNLRNY